MSSGMSEEELYSQARKRVEERKGFYIHFALYIAVNILIGDYMGGYRSGVSVVCLPLRWLGHRHLVSLLGGLRLLTTNRLGEKTDRKGSGEAEEKRKLIFPFAAEEA